MVALPPIDPAHNPSVGVPYALLSLEATIVSWRVCFIWGNNAQSNNSGKGKWMSVFPTKILLATDGSKEAALASQTAAELAQKTGSELHVIHVGETLGPGYSGYVGYEEGVLPSAQEELERQAQEVLDAQVERITVAEGARVQSHMRLGRPDKEIVTLGEEIDAGLIVMGSRGQGRIRRALMGSVSESVVRHAHCPVLVVRNEGSDK